MHNLLARQLRRHFGDGFEAPPEWRGLLDMVNQAYKQADTDRMMLERSLELSSQELTEAHQAEKASLLQQQLNRIAAEHKRFKDLANTVPAGVLRLDPHDNGDFANVEWLRITGFTLAQAVGRGWWNSIHPDDLKQFRELFTGLRKTGAGFSCEYRINKPPGTNDEVWVYGTAIAEQPDVTGRAGCIFCILDITERKSALKKIERSQRLESIGGLAGGIAHDLNNALAPINVGLDLLEKKIAKEDRRMLEIIALSTKRCSELVRNLVTFARGGEGTKENLPLKRLIDELSVVIRASFPKNIELVVNVPEGLPLALANLSQLHQVLLNLAVNARDAMPEGGRITLEAGIVKFQIPTKGTLTILKPGTYLRLTVADNGSGMTPDVQDHMFEPFFTTKAKGTGFGLSNVAGIIKEHQGDIHVYSLPGRGTTFHIYLPAQEVAAAPTATVTAPAKVDGGGRLVLVVDDEVNIRTLMKLLLSNANFQVVEAANGVAALAHVEELKERLDFIVTDMHMPELDGLGLIRKVKSLLPALPVIVMTGRLETGEKEELKTHHISAIIEKPFSPPTLFAALR